MKKSLPFIFLLATTLAFSQITDENGNNAKGMNDLALSGKIGIGTTTPSEVLEVNGNIKMDKLIVSSSLPDGQIFADFSERNKKCNIMTGGTLLNAATGGRTFNFLDFPVSNLNSKSRVWLGLEDRSYHQRLTFTAITGDTSWFGLLDKNQSEYFKVIEYDDGTGTITNALQMAKPNSRIVIGQYVTYLPEHKFVVKDGSAMIEGDILTNSNVGIGVASTNIPSGYKLAVAGKIISEEIKVQLESSGWPDFVFHKDYNLPTLQEVEKYIKDRGHLQDIPSAEDVSENGVLLGDMNARLLQKIEELTLYTIEQQKKIELQEKRLIKLEKLLKAK